MERPLRLAVVGLGRIGVFHALHVQELAEERRGCELVALVDNQLDRAQSTAREMQPRQDASISTFESVEELVNSSLSDAAVICSPTANHRQHATALVKAGNRVLVEKPLTGSLEDEREFTAELNRHHPDALMLAFQRRFDAPLLHAKRLLDEGRIGKPFKFVSALEDSGPPPAGYNSPGLLADMSVHNVDEILWLSSAKPVSTAGFGSRLYNHKLSTVDEDYDDAFVQIWLDDGSVAQIQVSRNHVSGYRVETSIFGEEGTIHVGHFQQERFEVVVEAYGRERRIDRQAFSTRNYARPAPEFVDRFGYAYKAELDYFIERTRLGERYSVNQNDGLRALEVASAANQSLTTHRNAVTMD